MADDKRFGAGDFGADSSDADSPHDGSFDDDTARDAAGKDSAGNGAGYDAALDESSAQSVSPAGAGADTDPLAGELSAIFAAALADEPPSRVTAESVLREARGEKRSGRSGFGAWLVSGRAPARWAGGLVAVAALVAAVIVVAPTTRSGTDSAVTAASGIYDSSSGSSESSEAAQERVAAADSAGGIAAAEAPPESGELESSSSSESSQQAPEAYTALSDAAGSDAGETGSGDGSAGDATAASRPSSEAAGPASSAADTGTQSSPPGLPCSLPELTPEEWAAALATLPSDVATTRLQGALCQEGALRGNGIEVDRGAGKPGAHLWLVVSQAPIGRNGAGSDSDVVDVSRGGETVTVIANQSGSQWLGDAALQRLVDAVAEAQG